MSDVDALRLELKRLSARATQAKMDLHDLSEELPLNWDKIPEIARLAYEAFASLEHKRAELKELAGA